jgi:hypothetical protein
MYETRNETAQIDPSAARLVSPGWMVTRPDPDVVALDAPAARLPVVLLHMT